jgi:DNA-binding transcriptional MocR family regulator
MDPGELKSVLGRWSSRGGPLYLQLAHSIKEAIQKGDVRVGARLPAERALADSLGVSRTTVVAAYDVLRGEEWLRSRQGSGTWAELPSTAVRQRWAAMSLPGRSTSSLRTLVEGPGDSIDFVVAALPGDDCIDDATLAGSAAHLKEAARDHGYLTLGHPSLREAIALHVSRWGLPTDASQIIVTSGAAQAISLLTALLVRPGDVVAVEDPTFVAAIDVFTWAGARAVGVPVGPQGVLVEAFRRIAHAERIDLAYLVPSCHNPTGTVLPEPQRRQLAAAIEELQVPVIDDTTLHDTAIERDAPPPLAAFAPDAQIITVGSLSKLFWGGLRIGWIRAPEQTIAQLARVKLLADLGSSIPSQLIGVELLARADEVRAARRQLLAHRSRLFGELLSEHLPSWTSSAPAGGMSVWVRLPHGDAGELARIAARHRVTIVSGKTASVSGGFADHVRFAYALEPATLREGIERLARAWAEYGSSEQPAQSRTIGAIV